MIDCWVERRGEQLVIVLVIASFVLLISCHQPPTPHLQPELSAGGRQISNIALLGSPEGINSNHNLNATNVSAYCLSIGPNTRVLFHGSALWWFAFTCSNIGRNMRDFKRRKLTAFTHFSGQPIGFLSKRQATLLQIVHEPTPRCTALIQKLTVTQLIKKPHVLYSPSVDAILSLINPVHSLPSYLFMLILPSHLPLRSPGGPFASDFLIKILCAFRFLPCESHSPSVWSSLILPG
jgi:hypothetical protein